MKLFKSPPSSLGFFSPITLLATWFGCGLFRWAPGTAGTVGALIAAILLLQVVDRDLFIALTFLCTLAGIFVSGKYADAHENKDPGEVVIDEVAGLWIAIACLPEDLMLYLPLLGLAFGLFRLFDIAKPWPVSWADNNLPGGLGIMMDDVIAGLMAGIVLLLVHSYIPEIFP